MTLGVLVEGTGSEAVNNDGGASDSIEWSFWHRWMMKPIDTRVCIEWSIGFMCLLWHRKGWHGFR